MCVARHRAVANRQGGRGSSPGAFGLTDSSVKRRARSVQAYAFQRNFRLALLAHADANGVVRAYGPYCVAALLSRWPKLALTPSQEDGYAGLAQGLPSGVLGILAPVTFPSRSAFEIFPSLKVRPHIRDAGRIVPCSRPPHSCASHAGRLCPPPRSRLGTSPAVQGTLAD